MTAWELVTDGFGRLEAPCIDAAGRICFADMRPPGAIHRIEHDGAVSTLAHREHVGGMVPHADGGLLVGGHSLSVIGDDGSDRAVFDPIGGWGFNDLATDARGNVYVGMHGERPTSAIPEISASLWLLRPGGDATRCYDGILLTNGLGISPDGSLLHHVDTMARTVWVSDVGDDGLPVGRRVLYDVPHGSPDGLAVDEIGCLWVAIVDAGKIVRIAPDGSEDLVLDGPRDWVASVCFGGTDGRDLLAVTFGEPYDEHHTGGVYRTRVDTPGATVHPARI